ncbi:MAG: hypothetical protein V3V49_01255 [Candidatus Krumholzibacteria bacterium]
MEIYIWLLGIFSILCGATSGFAGFFGTKDSDKKNEDRLSFFMVVIGMCIWAINFL